jgi:N-acetylmuramoyl-L-alanine amidase
MSEEPQVETGEGPFRRTRRGSGPPGPRRVRTGTLALIGLVAAACAVTVLIVLLTVGGGGRTVPDVKGLTFDGARKKVEGAGLSIEVDPTQDDSIEYGSLEVVSQDPKPGSGAERDDVVTVRLKGLPDAPELSEVDTEEPGPGPSADRTAPQQTPAAQPQAAARTVCLDPGHSNRTWSEVDPATGLNVGDNTGASGELRSNWELAQKVKARLEQAGYAVRLTKSSADSYASLRARADTGNSCDIMVRLHYDDSGFTGVLRPPVNGARCPVSDPSRITVVDAGVAQASNVLAGHLAAALGLSVRDDTGGTSQGNGTPPGHPTALIGSVLSRVPVVCIENRMELVRGNPAGQDQVADQTVQGINAYFR